MLKKILTILCLLVAVAYAGEKFMILAGLWFNGLEVWPALWRPFPDWGEGAQLYGALLPAKWNGTRTIWYGAGLLAVTIFTFLFKKYRLLSFFVFEGVLLELLDVFWLANGKYRWGWVAPGTDSAILSGILWAAALTLCGLYLYRRGGAPPVNGAPAAAADEPAVGKGYKYITYWCYFVACAFAGMKWLFAYWWWFDGEDFWSVAFRPFPDWGTGAANYGALLPSKWIGTRNFCYGLIILFGVFYSFKKREHRLLAFLLLQGVFIEFFDGFWLAYGKYNMGWVGPRTDFYMNGGFLWTPVLLSCGIYLFSKGYLESRRALAPGADT